MGNSIAITVSAVDQASAKLEAINKRIAAINAPIQRLNKAFSRFSDASGITKLSKGFEDLGRGSLTAFRNIARVVDPLAAITGAASIAGMVKLTEVWANFGSQLGFTAQRLGMTAGALQTWQGAATLAGASSSSLASGMQTLGNNMWNAAGGRAPEVTAAFRYLHLSFQNADGSARSLSTMMPLIADKIKAIQNPFAQAAVATAMFGGAAQDLLPLLRLGSAGMANYEAMAIRYGVTNKAGVTAANNLRLAQARLTLAVQGLGNSVAQRLAPVIDPLINQMSEWIARNRDWIATGIGTAVQQFATWLMKVNWPAVGQGIASVAHAISDVVTDLGGWGKAARDLAIYMGVSWLAGMMAPIVTITAALVRLIGLQRIAALGPFGALVGGAAASQVLAAAAVTAPLAANTNAQINSALTNGGAYPRGLRNNNPLNLMYAGQSGTTGQDDAGFGVYGTEQGGIAASVKQLLTYQSQGLTSISQMVTKWAPPSSNNTAAYIAAVSKMTGIDPNVPINMRDPATAAAIVNAMSNQEGDGTIAPGILSQGVNMGLGLPSGPPANIGNGGTSPGAGGVQKVQIDVTHANAPPGSSVKASSNSQNVAIGTLKIVKAMPGPDL